MKKAFLITILLFCSVPSINAMEPKKKKSSSDLTCGQFIMFMRDVMCGCLDNCAYGVKESYDKFKKTKDESIKKTQIKKTN